MAPDQQWHAPSGVAYGGGLVTAVPIPSAAPAAHTSTLSVAAAPLSEGSSSTGSLGCSQSNTDGQVTQVASNSVTKPTPEQALLVAGAFWSRKTRSMCTGSFARWGRLSVGASRMEVGTIRALHSVLLQLARPGMNDLEAYRSTGASRSNFIKWRRRVQNVQSTGGGSAVYEHLVNAFLTPTPPLFYTMPSTQACMPHDTSTS